MSTTAPEPCVICKRPMNGETGQTVVDGVMKPIHWNCYLHLPGNGHDEENELVNMQNNSDIEKVLLANMNYQADKKEFLRKNNVNEELADERNKTNKCVFCGDGEYISVLFHKSYQYYKCYMHQCQHKGEP